MVRLSRSSCVACVEPAEDAMSDCRCGEVATIITPQVSGKAGRLLCGACARAEAQPHDDGSCTYAGDYWVGVMLTWKEFRGLVA